MSVFRLQLMSVSGSIFLAAMSVKNKNGSIVINDFLSFVSHTWNTWPKEKLIRCLQGFYSKDVANEAFKILLESLPTKKHYVNKLKKVDEPNVFKVILQFMGMIKAKDLPTFVCKDLSNVPNTSPEDVKIPRDRRQRKFMKEHKDMKTRVQDAYDAINLLKSNINVLSQVCRSSSGQRQQTTDEEGSRDFGERPARRPRKKNPASLMPKEVIHTDERGAKNHDEELEFITPDRVVFDKARKSDILDDLIVSNAKEWTTFKSDVEDGDTSTAESEVPAGAMSSSETDPLDMNEVTSSEEFQISAGEEQEESSAASSKRRKVTSAEGKEDGTVFRCSKCCYSTRRPIRRHVCRKKKERQKSSLLPRVKAKCKANLHTCPLCQKKFSEDVWVAHVKSCEGSDVVMFSWREIYCHICDVFYASPTVLKYHLSFHEESRKYECLTCKYRFCSQTALDSHFKSHIPNKSLMKCPFCPKLSIRCRNQEHIRCHTGDRPYQCYVCQTNTTSFSRLSKHIKSHKEGRRKGKFVCEECGSCFDAYDGILHHIQRAHINENPLKCELCSEGFKTGKELEQHHLDRHSGLVDRYPCPFPNCAFEGRNAGSVGVHINVHTKSRPFTCSLCDFAANHKSYLTWHIRSHHSLPHLE